MWNVPSGLLCLKTYSTDCGTVWEGYGTFTSWTLAWRMLLLVGVGFWGFVACLALLPVGSLLLTADAVWPAAPYSSQLYLPWYDMYVCSVSSEAIIQRKPSSPKLLGQSILSQEQKKADVLHVETEQLLLQYDVKINLVEVAFRVVVSINSLCALLSSDSSDHIQNTSLNVLSFILCHACCPAPHGCPFSFSWSRNLDCCTK